MSGELERTGSAIASACVDAGLGQAFFNSRCSLQSGSEARSTAIAAACVFDVIDYGAPVLFQPVISLGNDPIALARFDVQVHFTLFRNPESGCRSGDEPNDVWSGLDRHLSVTETPYGRQTVDSRDSGGEGAKVRPIIALAVEVARLFGIGRTALEYCREQRYDDHTWLSAHFGIPPTLVIMRLRTWSVNSARKATHRMEGDVSGRQGNAHEMPSQAKNSTLTTTCIRTCDDEDDSSMGCIVHRFELACRCTRALNTSRRTAWAQRGFTSYLPK